MGRDYDSEDYDDDNENEGDDDPQSFLPLLEKMAAEVLTANLQSLQTLDPEDRGPRRRGRLTLRNAGDAQRLRRALPALCSATVCIRGGWQNVAAALKALSCAGKSTASIAAYFDRQRELGRPRGGSAAAEAAIRGEFVRFATALSDALRSCPVNRLELGPVHDETPEEERKYEDYINHLGADALFDCAADPAAAAATAAQLAEVLASREHGPCRLKLLSTLEANELMHSCDVGVPNRHVAPSGFSTLLLNALTPQSPLREFSAKRDQLDNDADVVEALAAALQPGRAPSIERLELRMWRLVKGARCASRARR